MPPPKNMNEFRPYVGKDYVISGYLLALEEKSWEKIAKTARWAVNKARKFGVTAIESNDLSKFKEKFFPTKLKKNQICLLALNKKGKVIAGIVLERQISNLLYRYGGSNQEGKESQANSFLLWETVIRFSNGKYNYLDLGASYRAELSHFKSQFSTDIYPIIINPPRTQPRIGLNPYYDHFLQNHDKSKYNEILPQLVKEYFHNGHTLLPDGRTAIYVVLKKLGLKKNDVVTIFTSFETPYVARDVTDTIQLICQYSRKIESNTKVLYVIHEWGFPFQNIGELIEIAKKNKLLLIEDCAHSLTSIVNGQRIGTWSDYSIYSLPKIFPCEHGGVLSGISIDDNEQTTLGVLDVGKRAKILENLGRDLKYADEYAISRRNNFIYLEKNLQKFGLTPYVKLTDDVVPHAFLLNVGSPYKILKLLRKFGIETGVYHQSQAILLPVHQNLTRNQLDYMIAVIKSHYS